MTLVSTCRLSQLNLPTQLLEAQSREVREGFVLFFFSFLDPSFTLLPSAGLYDGLHYVCASLTHCDPWWKILIENLFSLWSISAEPIHSALKAQSFLCREVREGFVLFFFLFFGSKFYSSSISWPLRRPPLRLCKPYPLWSLMENFSWQFIFTLIHLSLTKLGN